MPAYYNSHESLAYFHNFLDFDCEKNIVSSFYLMMIFNEILTEVLKMISVVAQLTNIFSEQKLLLSKLPFWLTGLTYKCVKIYLDLRDIS